MMLIVGTGTLSFYRVTKKEWKERMTTKKPIIIIVIAIKYMYITPICT